MRSAVIVLVVILVVGWIWYDEQLDRRNEEVEVLRAQVESRVDDEADLRRQLDACAEVLRAARKVTRAQDPLVLGLYDDMSAGSSRPIGLDKREMRPKRPGSCDW